MILRERGGGGGEFNTIGRMSEEEQDFHQLDHISFSMFISKIIFY